jgi:hypothetical protein
MSESVCRARELRPSPGPGVRRDLVFGETQLGCFVSVSRGDGVVLTDAASSTLYYDTQLTLTTLTTLTQ